MDQLLKQKNITELDNERRELFGFLTRFGKKIMEFSYSYQNSYDEMTKALEKDVQSAKHRCNELANAQAGDEAKMKKSYELQHKNLEDEIQRAKDNYKNFCAKLDKEYDIFEENVKKELKSQLDYGNNKVDSMKKGGEEVEFYLNHGFPNSFSDIEIKAVKKKIKTLLKNPSSLKLDDVNQAITEYNKAVKTANAYRKKISKWDYSLVPIIHIIQKHSLIDDLCVEYKNIELCIEYTKNYFDDQYKKLSAKKDLDRKNRRSSDQADRKKKEEERDRKIKEIQGRISQNFATGNEAVAQLQAKNKSEYDNRKQEYQAQYDNDKNRWEKLLADLNYKFVNEMEIEFPAEQVKLLFEDIRSGTHLGSVETVAASVTFKNVVVGEAFIPHATKFYEKNAGALVLDLMQKKYSCMFSHNPNVKGGIDYNYLSVPYTLSLAEGSSLVIMHKNAMIKKVAADMNSVAIRMLLSVPAGQMQFHLMDADSMSSFSPIWGVDPFKHSNEADKAKGIVIGNRICDDSNSTSTQMRDAYEGYNKLSGSSCRNLIDFNSKNKMSPRPFEVALATTYPKKMDADTINRINKLASDCGRWGFSSICALSETNSAQYLKGEMLANHEKLRSNSVILTQMDNGMYEIDGSVSESTGLSSITGCEKGTILYLFPVPSANELAGMGDSLYRINKKEGRKEIEFIQAQGVCPTKEEMFKCDATDGIYVPLGYMEDGNVFSISFSDSHIHAVINGTTGSGKTNLLHVLLCNTMLRYTRDAVEIYLVDFKHGTDFKIYAQYNLQNFRAINICNEPEFALEMLRNIDKEFERRSTILGESVSNIVEYNRMYPNNKMSRILLVLDELNQFMETADSDVRTEAIELLRKLARQGRSFGIHMVVAGQDLHKIGQMDLIVAQSATRVVLHSGSDAINFLMGDGSDVAKSRMNGISNDDKGHCVVSTDSGKNPFVELTAKLDDQARMKILSHINRYYMQNRCFKESLIFATDISQVGTNRIQYFHNFGAIHPDLADEVFFASPISMDQTRFNIMGSLWLMGGNSDIAQKAGFSSMFFITLSLVLRKWKGLTDKSNHDCYLYVCNGADDGKYYGEDDRLGDFCKAIPKNWIQYMDASKGQDLLNCMVSELNRRTQQPANDVPIYIILPKVENCTGFNNGMNALDFCRLISKGPEYGMYTILWTQDLTKAKDMQLIEASYQDKVIFETSGEDSLKIPGGMPKNVKGYKAVMSQTKKRLRVYDIPQTKWMEDLVKRFQG